MLKFLKNKILEKIFYWFSAIAILVLFPLLIIFILRLGNYFSPLGFIIKVAIYLFCGGVTLTGLIAIILFFYETIKKESKAFNVKKK
tara:strand:- start:858 stop:1118 length:261 start_codon:yes stop_codon:yes gene_type:complete